jgi:5-(hydroxymethyl)furfural/furfural oxidase
MSTHFDTIIVGGGSAGAVLSNRLSARSGHRVLLIEAGEDTPVGAVPEAILDSFPGTAYLNPRFTWNELEVTTEAIPHNRPDARPRLRKYEQARVLGGGSSINGQLANRGSPDDYDEWEARGAAGWNWSSVLPYFRKLEHDVDFDGPLHGNDGPIGISRIFPERWPGHAVAMAKALTAVGLAYQADQNGSFEDGHFPIPISNVNDRRVTTATAYLDPATRQRANLTVLTRARATGLRFEGTRCAGVTAVVEGRMIPFTANEVILSCGAIQSPALLLRAGIGPASELRELGIGVLADRPGVGRGLMDHPSVAVAAFVLPHARINGRTRRHLLLGLRFSSGLQGTPRGDMAATIATKSAWHPVGDQIASVNIWVNKTYSDAGRVRLKSTDWRDMPQVDFNLLSDRRDLERLAGAVRRFAGLLDRPELRGVVTDPFPASYSDKVRQVATITIKNRVLTTILARLLDGPAPLRHFLIEKLIVEGPPLATLLRDDEALEAFIRRATVGVWHASCSCRMGSDDDPMAVTTPGGHVRGVEGLRVVDASIFPVIPCANINLSTIMVAERIADGILHGA